MKLAPFIFSLILSPCLDAGLPGPTLVKDIRSGTSGSLQDFSRLITSGDRIYTTANDGTTGWELWKTDGTAAGTVQVKDIRPGYAGSEPMWMMAVGNSVYFSANGGSGSELWKSDGTPAGTVMVINLNGSYGSTPRPLFARGSVLYFTATDTGSGTELWKTDGTTAGTSLLKDIATGTASSGVSNPFEFNAIHYFFAADATAGRELWRTDGTPAGTYLLKDINPGSASAAPADLVAVGNLLYFTATDGVHGRELWRTDGTPAGTTMIKDIGAGPEDGSVHYPAATGNYLYFSAKLVQPETSWAIWRTDGTEAGTIPLLPVLNLVNVLKGQGNTLYFSAQVPGNPARHWKSQGTVASTQPDSDAGFYTGRLYPWGSGHCSVNTNAKSIWQNDGPGAKWYEVADLSAGSTIYLNPYDPAVNGGKLYLHASGQGYGNEVFAYDLSPPSVAKPEPASITRTSAVLKGAINPNGSATTAVLEFGPGPDYGNMIHLSFSGDTAGTGFLPFEIPFNELAPDHTYHYKVTATSSKGTRVATGTFHTSITRGDWRLAKFGVAENAGMAADDQDPDHDGLSNLIEYAFRLDPLRWDASSIPQGQAGYSFTLFEFTHPEGLEDVSYGVEWSTTLSPGSWTPVEDIGSGNYHKFWVPTGSMPKVFTHWTVDPG